MTHNRNNQIKNKMISQYPKTDREKLAGLERFVHKEWPKVVVLIEPFMMFTKGEEQFCYHCPSVGKITVGRFLIHPSDLILYVGDKMIVFELDGSIHDIKTEKTDKRNKRYELNNIPYIVINESELKLKLAIPHSTKLTQNQINTEFKERFDNHN